MIKSILIGMVVALSIFLVACTAPPEELPRATTQPAETQEVPEPVDETQIESTADESTETEESAESEVTLAANQRAIDSEASSFEWEGYGPGKSHIGTFNDWEGTMTFEEGEIVGLQGTVQMESLESDSGGLDGKLRSTYFNVAEFPTSSFESTSVADGQMTGDLTFMGVTNSITFPIETTADSVTTEFVISISDFGLELGGVNDEARIGFSFVAQ